MTSSRSESLPAKDDIARSLTRRATELWGLERADELRGLIDQTADHVWRLAENLPADEEEPGFYF